MSDPSLITYLDSAKGYTTSTLIEAMGQSQGVICVYDSRFVGKPDPELLLACLHASDIVHHGLSVHGGLPLTDAQLCTSNWNFLNPITSIKAVSWKPTLQFAVFHKSLYDHLEGLDPAYRTPEYALIDFAYRVMMSGGLSVSDPEIISATHQTIATNDQDEARFILKYLNRKAFAYFRFCMLLSKGKFIQRPRNVVPWTKNRGDYPYKLMNGKGQSPVRAYSAIIPTINRYDYIGKSIQSLLRLSFPPSEIIIVDQSPVSKRNQTVYQDFEQSGIVKVIFLDSPGQSTARNEALRAATSEWVLLFEDDAEAWPEMVNEHVNLLARSGADVSTGVVVAPGADENFIPVNNRRYCLSDILTTGNAFLSRTTALEAGGFDPAFDRGSGADDDFGKRLYLRGKKIIYNYKSIETHYKAPTGGMREHGAWWRNHSTLLGPYPPATQMYAIQKYYDRKFRSFLVLSLILKAKKRYTWPSYFLLLLLLPVKLSKSLRQANRLKEKHEDTHRI